MGEKCTIGPFFFLFLVGSQNLCTIEPSFYFYKNYKMIKKIKISTYYSQPYQKYMSQVTVESLPDQNSALVNPCTRPKLYLGAFKYTSCSTQILFVSDIS